MATGVYMGIMYTEYLDAILAPQVCTNPLLGITLDMSVPGLNQCHDREVKSVLHVHPHVLHIRTFCVLMWHS